jgi:hypothetical protein
MRTCWSCGLRVTEQPDPSVVARRGGLSVLGRPMRLSESGLVSAPMSAFYAAARPGAARRGRGVAPAWMGKWYPGNGGPFLGHAHLPLSGRFLDRSQFRSWGGVEHPAVRRSN